MATTTTAPYLFSATVTKPESDDYPYLLVTHWRGTLLATGETVEVIQQSTIPSADFLTQTTWDDIYSDFIDKWNTATANTGTFTNPVTIP